MDLHGLGAKGRRQYLEVLDVAVASTDATANSTPNAGGVVHDPLKTAENL